MMNDVFSVRVIVMMKDVFKVGIIELITRCI